MANPGQPLFPAVNPYNENVHGSRGTLYNADGTAKHPDLAEAEKKLLTNHPNYRHLLDNIHKRQPTTRGGLHTNNLSKSCKEDVSQ